MGAGAHASAGAHVGASLHVVVPRSTCNVQPSTSTLLPHPLAPLASRLSPHPPSPRPSPQTLQVGRSPPTRAHTPVRAHMSVHPCTLSSHVQRATFNLQPARLAPRASRLIPSHLAPSPQPLAPRASRPSPHPRSPLAPRLAPPSHPPRNLGFGQLFFEFGILGACRTKQVHHTDRGSPASAARKAAFRAILRIFPPATFRRASLSKSRFSIGASGGNERRQISARCAASGNGNCTTKRMRRRNAVSSALFRFVVRIARPRYASIRWSR